MVQTAHMVAGGKPAIGVTIIAPTTPDYMAANEFG